MTVKNEIKLQDKVVFISGTTIRRGTVIKINKSTYKIEFKATPFHSTTGAENIKKEKVAHENDVLIAFWDNVKDKSHMGSHWNYNEHQHLAQKATRWVGTGFCVWLKPDGQPHLHIS